MTSPFKPINFDTESLKKEKLQTLATNVQWVFENMPRVRHMTGASPRDSGIKIIAGKTPYAARTDQNWTSLTINFGTFFTPGCRPAVSTSLETTGGSYNRSKVVLQGRGGELNHVGFTAIISGDLTYKTIPSPGWVHWIAIGY